MIRTLNPRVYPYGVVLALFHSDPQGSIELERAPDVAGSPGTYASLVVVPAAEDMYTDIVPVGTGPYWYRARTLRQGYTPSSYTAAIKVTPVDIVGDPTNPYSGNLPAVTKITVDFGNDGVVRLNISGNETALSFYARVGINSTPTDPTSSNNHGGALNVPSPTLNTGQTCPIGDTATVKVRAYGGASGAGVAGDVFQVTATRPIPDVSGVTVTGSIAVPSTNVINITAVTAPEETRATWWRCWMKLGSAIDLDASGVPLDKFLVFDGPLATREISRGVGDGTWHVAILGYDQYGASGALWTGNVTITSGGGGSSGQIYSPYVSTVLGATDYHRVGWSNNATVAAGGYRVDILCGGEFHMAADLSNQNISGASSSFDFQIPNVVSKTTPGAVYALFTYEIILETTGGVEQMRLSAQKYEYIIPI